MSTGFVLNIPQEMINRLDLADQKIEKLAKTSEDAQVRIVSAFKSMSTNGVDAFIQRLDVAQQKLAQLGGTQINMGINANTSGFQQLIDAINNLSQASKTNITINGLGTVGNQTQTAIDAINKLMATLQQLQQMGGQQFLGGVNSLGRQTLREMNREAKKMQKTMQDLDDAIQKYGISATDLANKLQQARQAQQQFNDAAKQQAQADVSGLVNQKGQQRTLNELKNYANELKRTMANLDPKSQEWAKLNNIYKQTNREIKNIQDSMKDVQKQSRSLMDISGQLARRLALVFSVSQITGYVKKLIEVRGEFELQQRSLQAILQNKDEANRIWQQTVDLAVRSPFRVKELVSYTKQLAAYRIESDKLFETNKMLADISAGLGVDMQRLILAFGQVRSAAYLRGTELRQFTEAGIPILEQLAQYFTELEGRAVSVGDVFERVSKRMVSFADVEEIFRRMTAEGGTFYRMQEIQAETLKGMWSNLKDSVDIMIDSIGRANEDTLKGSLKFVKELVDNYKDLVDVIKAWTIALSPVITVTALSRVATSKLGMAIYGVATQTQWSFNILQKWEAGLVRITNKSAILGGTLKVLSKALAGLGIGAVIFGIGALVKGLSNAYLKATELSRANKRLKESWEGIFAEDSAELEKSASGYTDLIMRLREANEGSQDRKNIINRLNNEYGQYLDFVVDEKTTLDQLADSYDTVIKRMKEKASLATYEEGVAAIEREYTTALKNAREEFYDIFEGASVRLKGNKLGDNFKAIIPTKQDIDNIYALLQQKVESLNKDQMDSLAEQQQLIQGIVAGYYGEEYFLSRDYADAIDLINILIERKEKEVELQKEIDARFKETLSSRKANLRYQEIENKYTLQKQQVLAKNQVDEVLADIDKELGLVIEDINKLSDFDVKKILDALAKQFELNKIKLQFDFDLISEQKYNEERNKIINWATLTTKSINESITSQLGGIFSEEELSKVLVTEEKQAKGMASILKDIESAWKAQNDTIAEQISLKSEGLVADEKLLERAIRMEELYRKVADILGIELKYTERLSEESRNAINAMLPEEYQISLEAAYGGIDSILKGLKDKETEHLNVIEQLNEQKKNGLPIDEERLRLAEEAYWWTKKTQDLLDPKAKTAISESKVTEINAKLEEKYQIDSIDRTKDEVTLLQEANTERQNAIAYLEQLKNQKAQGLTVSQAELDLAKKDVEQYTLLWKFLGGIEKDKTRTESLMDERIKVVDDMNKAYKDLNKTLSKAESLEGAFAKYKDAFGKAYKGTSLLPKNFANMTAEQFIKEFNFTTEEGMVGFFDKLIAYAKKTSERVDVELAKGDYIMETRLQIQKDADKELLDEIQELFDQYDLSLELKKLNIPSDLAKSLFDVDYLDLDGLKKAVMQQREYFVGKDMLDEYDDLIQKIGELSRKRQEEEAKEFINFLKKNLNEIQIIQDKGAYNISLADRLFGEGKITAEQYMSSIRQIVEDTNKEVAKVNLDKFKDSTTYIKAMGNLAAYSRDELEGMINALQGQVGANAGNMGADEIRAYYEALERLVDQYDKIESPFQKGEINDLIEYLGLQKQLNQEKEKEAALEQRKFELNARLEGLQAKLASQQASGDTEGAKFTQGLIKSTVNELKEVDGKLVSVTSNISVISEKVANLGDGMIKGLVVAQKIVNEIANIANASIKMFNDIKSAADALGADTESGGWAKAGYAMEMVGGVSSELTSGLSNLASGNFAGVLANVVGLVTKLISGFAKIHDQDYQDIIEAQAEEVERLGKAYEKLEQATEKAYSIESLQKANTELERNVELQIASYKAMISAEKAKKNTDEEQLKAYNEELEALTEQWEELKQSLVEGVGGVTDYRSQTREFVDSWVSAFQETDNGLDGLKNNFREFFDNIIAEQAAMRVTEKFLEPFYESLNEALKDYELTAKESKDLREMVEKIAPDLSAALEKIWSQLGGSRGESGGNLSALQKGIQGITESTAQVLEAIANSSRGYLASIDSKFDVLLASIGSGSEENPMLEQMRLVARNTIAINTLLNSLVKGGHSQGGVGLKVFMD